MKRKVLTDGNGSNLILVERLGEYLPRSEIDKLAEENAQLKNQLHDLFEHVTGVSVSEYKPEQMPYLADYLIGQAEADDSCINKLKADKAELIAFVESVANCHAIIGIGDEDVSDKGRARKLLNKHEDKTNEQ